MMNAMTILGLVELWAGVGALVALVFLTIGIDRIDEDARGAYVFRPLIFPGVVLLWPLVLWRWWVLETGRDRWTLRHAPPRRAHARVWLVLGVVIPAIFVVALVLRQSWPANYAPQRIAPPSEQSQ